MTTQCASVLLQENVKIPNFLEKPSNLCVFCVLPGTIYFLVHDESV